MERYEEARNFYTTAFNNKKTNISLLLRRAICSMELKKYDPALDDINRLLESDV
jgi:tetratricopeptide (TPR) repeat protein